MRRGLIQQQIGFASRVRPEGAIKASWEAFLKEQVERDEAILFAEPMKCELRPDTIDYPKRRYEKN